MEVGRLDVEADVPAVPMPGDSGEQQLGAGCDDPSLGLGIQVLDGTEQPSQRAGVIVDSNYVEL
jgi:hypothetical protein